MALKVDDISKVPSKQKIFLTVLICLLMGAGYYYLYYRSASQKIDALQKQLDELQSKIKEQEVIAKNLPSFQEEVRRLEMQLGLLLDQLPNSAEIPDLLKNVSDLGKESGLEFLKFVPGGEVNKGFYAEIPVAISVNGEYHGFAAFADRVSHLPRIVNLADIAFSPSKPGATGGATVNVSCTATTFRFLEQGAAGKSGKGSTP
jgi:type IV pilus assembly protein PilO